MNIRFLAFKCIFDIWHNFTIGDSNIKNETFFFNILILSYDILYIIPNLSIYFYTLRA